MFPDVGSKEVESLIDVLCLRTVFRIVGNFDCPTVVLEHPAMHTSMCGCNGVAMMLHFLEDPDDGKCVLQGS